MATYGVTDTQLTAIADAIRLKRDIITEMTVDEMPLQIALIDTGGGTETLDALIDRSITSITSNADKIGDSSFVGCSELVNAYFPLAKSIGVNAFNNCYKIELLDLIIVNTINSGAFTYCTKLKTLILRNNNVCYLPNPNAFLGTPFYSNGTGGTLYVPRNLISSYQANANWNTVLSYNANNQILAIEDMQ